MLFTLNEMWPELSRSDKTIYKQKSTVFPNAVWAFMWWWIVLICCNQVNGTGKKNWMSGCVMIQSIVTLEACKEYKHVIEKHETLRQYSRQLKTWQCTPSRRRKASYDIPSRFARNLCLLFAQSHVVPWGIPYILLPYQSYTFFTE